MDKRETLIKARKDKGMTQQELADAVCISRSFLANIERGEYDPSLKVAQGIATVLEKDVGFLFFDNIVRKTHYQATTTTA